MSSSLGAGSGWNSRLPSENETPESGASPKAPLRLLPCRRSSNTAPVQSSGRRECDTCGRRSGSVRPAKTIAPLAIATTPFRVIVHSFSPWNGEAAPDSGFPFLAGSKKLVVDYDISLAASGSYNLAFEFWAVSAVPPSKDTITHEVMIWIASENLASAGVEVGKMTVDGHAFGINMRKNHGDASGDYGNNKWTYISLIAEKPILHGPLDIGQIIARLIEQGHLTPKLYIANLELADEVQRGSGTTIVSDYAVHVE
jgi:hypothetical protein